MTTNMIFCQRHTLKGTQITVRSVACPTLHKLNITTQIWRWQKTGAKKKQKCVGLRQYSFFHIRFVQGLYSPGKPGKVMEF